MENGILNQLEEPRFTIVITLSSKGSQTKVEWQTIFNSVRTMEEAVRAVKADEALKQNMHKLAIHLESHKKGVP